MARGPRRDSSRLKDTSWPSAYYIALFVQCKQLKHQKQLFQRNEGPYCEDEPSWCSRGGLDCSWTKHYKHQDVSN